MPKYLLVNKKMLRSGYLPLHTPQDMSYSHEVVINDVSKVVSGISIAFHQNGVPFVQGHVVCYSAKDDVIKNCAI